MGLKIAVAGASGFVGSKLVPLLADLEEVDLVRGLSRSEVPVSNAKIQHQKCDLFSLKDVESGLKDIDIAIYLVHSMLPSSELAQGSFEDYDLILADNFARGCLKQKVSRVIYLSGIIPTKLENRPEALSRHLRSRLEVEKVFNSFQIPLLSFRAGIILGPGGSSFEILLRLVRRLPALVCPAWTQGKSNPIHIRDVCESFKRAVLNPKLTGIFDLAGPESLSYFEMIQKCSQLLEKDRPLLNVPFFSPKLSRLWVSTVTGAPANLVYPLIESLKHDMQADPQKTFRIPDWEYTSFKDALQETLLKERQPKAFLSNVRPEKEHVVQSVQRIPIPAGCTATRAAELYKEFLNDYFNGLIRVETEGPLSTFYWQIPKKVLLILEHSAERSSSTREMFYIRGGLLDKGHPRARLEFRECRHEPSLLIAIHDFKPNIAWYIYKRSQAPFHLHVMRAFGKYLNQRLSGNPTS